MAHFASASPVPGPPVTTIDAAPKALAELLTVARAASRLNVRVRFTGIRARPLEDLVSLAAAGGDCVSFVRERELPDMRDLAAERRTPRWSFFGRR